MAKKRKATCKRKLLDRKLRVDCESTEKTLNMDEKLKPDADIVIEERNEMSFRTEACKLPNYDPEYDFDCKENAKRDVKKIRSACRKPHSKVYEMEKKYVVDKNTVAEVNIYPVEIDGETCIDVTCGDNEAVLYLSKLRMGSKGASIKFSNSWLTPNEFQTISGRETAKDWKRSIRHKGRSLKLLIEKGLITVQSVSTKHVAEMTVEKAVNNEMNAFSVCTKEGKQTEDIKERDAGYNKTVPLDTIDPDIPILRISKGYRGRKPKNSRRGRKRRMCIVKQQPENVDETDVKKVKLADDVKLTCMALKTSVKINHVGRDTSESHDPNPDEGQRLDEFVRTLKLTKSAGTNNSSVEDDEAKEIHFSNDDEEPEMPVLQREVDTDPATQCADTTGKTDNSGGASVNVDNLHATVTPPPTPPSDHAQSERRTNDSHIVETFKARLAPPKDGLRLTINREKVTPSVEESSAYMTEDVKSTKSESNTNMQFFLLQDALKSAKRYKEKLKQNSVSPSIASVPNQYISEISSKTVNRMKSSSSSETIFSAVHDSQIQHSMSPSLPSISLATTSSTNISSSYATPSTNFNIPHQNKGIRYEKNCHNLLKQTARNNLAFCSEMHSRPKLSSIPNQRAISQRLQSMTSKEGTPRPPREHFWSDTTSNLRSHQVHAESTEATLATLQKYHRQTMNMIHLMMQGPMNGLPSSSWHPIIAQQILLAATQPFYSKLPSPDVQSPPSKYDVTKAKVTESHRTAQPYLNHKPRKRKHNDVDSAMDLSVKHHKSGHCHGTEMDVRSNRNFCENPLDFSMTPTNVSLRTNPGRIDNNHIKTNHKNDFVPYSRSTPSCTSSQNIATSCMCAQNAEDITTWNVERVCSFLLSLDGCNCYAKTFREHGISGKILPYLTTQHLTRTLGMKVGPALTLITAIKDIQDKSTTLSQHCLVHRPSAIRIHN